MSLRGRRVAMKPFLLIALLEMAALGYVVVSNEPAYPDDPTISVAGPVAGPKELPPRRLLRGDLVIPASIDSTGVTEVSKAMQAFIDRIPNESTIVFRWRGVYRLDRGLVLTNRHGLVFDGNGATLQVTGCTSKNSPFELADLNDRITIRNFALVGGNEDGGTTDAYDPGCEYQAGVAIYQSTNVEIANVTIRKMQGDCLYVDAGGPDYVWSENVWFHDSACLANGRMGVAITGARGVTIEHVTFDQLAFFVLDIEPFLATGGATDVVFRENRVGTYGHSPRLTSYFFAADGEAGAVIERITVSRNLVTGGFLTSNVTRPRRRDIVFANNRSTMRARGTVLEFHHVDGLVVTGNVQPRQRGPIAEIIDCSGVTAQ